MKLGVCQYVLFDLIMYVLFDEDDEILDTTADTADIQTNWRLRQKQAKAKLQKESSNSASQGIYLFYFKWNRILHFIVSFL